MGFFRYGASEDGGGPGSSRVDDFDVAEVKLYIAGRLAFADPAPGQKMIRANLNLYGEETAGVDNNELLVQLDLRF